MENLEVFKQLSQIDERIKFLWTNLSVNGRDVELKLKIPLRAIKSDSEFWGVMIEIAKLYESTFLVLPIDATVESGNADTARTSF